MTTLVTNVAIFRDGEVLLQKREDFEVWCLPGGHVENSESAAQAAVREVREETGFEVELTCFVGLYYHPGLNGLGMHNALFSARLLGGTLQCDPGETLDARFFPVHALPPDTVWWHQQRILDAAAATSGGGQAWQQNVTQPHDPTRSRQKVYAQRDASGLSRAAFFMQEFGNPALGAVKLEVGQLPPPAHT